MNNPQQPAGIADAIPSLDNEQAAWTHAGARILSGHGYDVTVVSASGTEPNWYLGDFVAFRPPLSARAALGAPVEELMHVLSTHEPALKEIETATGLASEFTDHGPPRGDWAVAVLSKSGEMLGEVAFLAEPPMAGKPSASAPIAPLFVVARLAMGDAERLTGGDMVVLEKGPWSLVAVPGSMGHDDFAIDPASGRLGRVFADVSHSTAPSQQEPAPMNNPDDMGNLSVPITLKLPDILVSPVELARLADGGTLELGPIAEGVQVALAVGGRTVGHGEIVRLGDRFAVLMDEPAETDPASENVVDNADDNSAGKSVSDDTIAQTASQDADMTSDILTAEQLSQL